MAKATRGVSESIYTVLMFATVVALGAGVGYVAYRSDQLFGNFNPLSKAAELPGMILPMLGG